MSRISVRGIAVASATAVTTVGAVVGVASGSEPTAAATQPVADATALDSIAGGQQANVQAASLTAQVQTQQAAADASAKQAASEAARKQAAADAAAKKKAADDAAAKAKAERDAQAASRSQARTSISTLSSGDFSVSGIQAMAQQIIGDSSQYQCFSNIVSRESGWNYQAVNAGSGAYGLVQALPGSKMASAGADWQTNPATQIKWGLGYMNSRYGSPCGAWSFWQANSWY